MEKARDTYLWRYPMLSLPGYSALWLYSLEQWYDYLDHFHPAYGGWARYFRHLRTGQWH